LQTPIVRFWKNKHHLPDLKAAARELLGVIATSALSEQVFGVAVTMLEPTKETVEPTTLGITAIQIELDQIHSAICATTSTFPVV